MDVSPRKEKLRIVGFFNELSEAAADSLRVCAQTEDV